MNFRKSYSKFTVVRAILQGVVIGLVAVFVVGLVLFSSGGKEEASKTVATAGPKAEKEDAAEADGQALTMFVKQHGVFSNADTASDFVGEHPSLAQAAVVEAGGQFYVWGAAWLKESDVVLKEGEQAFKKKIQVVPGSCKAADVDEVKKVLLADDLAKIELSGKDGKDQKKSDLSKKLSAVNAFTKDSSVARLHMLSHYSMEDSCLKIQF